MKQLTQTQITELANANGLDYASLMAVIDVESRGSGFNADGTPIILFEPHIFWRMLGQMGYKTLRQKMQAHAPHLLYPKWGTYHYGKTSEQHGRLDSSINLVFRVLPNLDSSNPNDKKIIDDVRACALMSCSWGMGQIMGLHWQNLGYDSVQDFVNAMYDSEKSQLDAMLRFIKQNGLLGKLQRHEWTSFAKGYNGAGFAKNRYDVKLRQAYGLYA